MHPVDASNLFLYTCALLFVMGVSGAYSHNKQMEQKVKKLWFYERAYSYVFYSIPSVAGLFVWTIIFLHR